MKYRLAILILCFVVTVTTTAIAHSKAPAATPQSPGQEQTKTQAPPEEPPPVLAVPPGYRYEAQGRRDPFVNPFPKPAPPGPNDKPIEPPRPPGMKGALEAEVALLGVFVAKDDPSLTRAILQIPGMRAPVMASRGDAIYDAVIKEIRTDSVIFTMVAPGNKPRNPSEEHDVIKKLRSTAGDKK